MKRLVLLFAIFIFAAITLCAQDAETRLPDRVMKQVVRQLVTRSFDPRQSPETIYISGGIVRKEWLPKIRNINFVTPGPNENSKGLKGYTIGNLQRRSWGYLIGIGYGDIGCGSGRGGLWSFHVDDGRVRRLRPARAGWGWANTCGSSNATDNKSAQ